MIGKEQFDHMKPTAFFVNVCRGSVVNEPELIEALRNKKMRGAGLDVFEKEPADPANPLFQMNNVITAPHLAGSSVRSAWLSRQRASQQVAAVLRGDWPTAAQNPEVASRLEAKTRMKGTVGKVIG
jgi:phosphoglycerate dehydrogenase-like enzyme